MKKGNIICFVDRQKQSEKEPATPIKETTDDLGEAIQKLIARMREFGPKKPAQG